MHLRFHAAANDLSGRIIDLDTGRTVATLPDPVYEKELGALFESAPALLAGLREIANMRPPFHDDKREESAARAAVIGDMRQVAKAAIAKAKGES